MPSGTLYPIALVRIVVSEDIASIFRVIGFHSCVTVDSLLIDLPVEGYYLLSKKTVLWDAFIVASVIDALWDFIRCGSS
jgi:hypothetical protein